MLIKQIISIPLKSHYAKNVQPPLDNHDRVNKRLQLRSARIKRRNSKLQSTAQKPDPIDQGRRGSTTPLRSQKTAQTNVNEKRVHGSFGSQSLSFPDPCRPRSYVLD